MTKLRSGTKKKRSATAGRNPGKGWSLEVTKRSDALDLQRNVFTMDDPKKIAASLKRSAERSHRRKSEPYRSAMSILTFYINRAGASLSARRKRVLEQVKDELRENSTANRRGALFNEKNYCSVCEWFSCLDW